MKIYKIALVDLGEPENDQLVYDCPAVNALTKEGWSVNKVLFTGGTLFAFMMEKEMEETLVKVDEKEVRELLVRTMS